MKCHILIIIVYELSGVSGACHDMARHVLIR